jgi:hypothetical protein
MRHIQGRIGPNGIGIPVSCEASKRQLLGRREDEFDKAFWDSLMPR